MKTEFGLIGHPLSHSFSQQYFRDKFDQLNLEGYDYQLFDLADIEEVNDLISSHPNIAGLNVTIPYKQQIIPYLTQLDESAHKVGAVNVVHLQDQERIGYNSDYYGFKQSLENWLPSSLEGIAALVLGTGGASKAVIATLTDLEIPFQLVSRTKNTENLCYEDLKTNEQILATHHLVVNTTPVGMFPHDQECPEIPTDWLDEEHYIYDLVYNPVKTMLLKLAEQRGAQIKNGLEMLHLQAEKSWEIWNA